MSLNKTSTKHNSQYIDNWSFDQDLNIATFLLLGHNPNVAGELERLQSRDGVLMSQEAQLEERVDIAGSIIYTGEATPGTATSAAGWRIKKYDLTGISGKYADSVTTFTKVWDDRATYTY